MIRWFVRLLLKLCFRVRVHGTLERHDRLLVVSNHQSLLDGVLLGAFLPVTPVWVLHTTIAKLWYVRLPMRFLPHLVVDTANPLAMKAVIELIEAGTPVLIFPEGRVTVTGTMMKIYPGPAFAAARTGATVVPVHIDGAVYSIFSRMAGDFPRKWFPRITITIHAPRTITAPDVAGAKLRRALETEALRKIMQQSAYEAHRRTTLFPALLDAIALHGRRRRILQDVTGKEMTYGGLLKASLALGRLLARVATQGEFTGVLLPNVAATAAVIYGMFSTGRVPAMLNYSAGIDGLQSACRTAGIRTVITSRAFLEKAKLAAVAEHLEGVRLVYLEDLRASFDWLDKLWLLGWALRFPRAVAAKVRPEDPAVVVFTSGSEGKPKGVALSHGALVANVAQCRAVIEFAPADRFLSALPLFHTFGFTVGIILPLASGSRVFLYTSPLHYRVVPELIYEYDCTVLFASSTFLGNYAKYANPFDFRTLRLVVAGAEKLNDEVRRLYADKFGIGILEGYGVTETSPVLSVNTPMAHKTGTVGELFPGLEYRLEPVEGIAEGGLLHVRGPNVMLGYLSEGAPGRIEPVASVFGAGWYNTGDLVEVDGAGYIRILGRQKRFAKVAGEMVSLELVERIAAAASPNALHAAVACQEPGRGEIIVLFTGDRELRREPLQRAARSLGAPELALPRRIVALVEMPYLGNGKRDYVTLNRMARELAGQPLAKA
jgi:acyl-[acyl-carrier-protein]-phospholipid O-acyltransferase / long-chain-fatty-acid--[acyl-carrier-protein] ligase